MCVHLGPTKNRSISYRQTIFLVLVVFLLSFILTDSLLCKIARKKHFTYQQRSKQKKLKKGSSMKFLGCAQQKSF